MRTVIVVFALLFTSVAFGQEETNWNHDGHELLKECSVAFKTYHVSNSWRANYCVGLIRGIEGIWDERERMNPNGYKRPFDIDIHIVLGYLQANPDQLNDPDILLVQRALTQAHLPVCTTRGTELQHAEHNR